MKSIEYPVADSVAMRVNRLDPEKKQSLEKFLRFATAVYLDSQLTNADDKSHRSFESFLRRLEAYDSEWQEQYFKTRPARANLKHAREILDQVPDAPPIPGDE
ncbi:MAG: hypothetical protein NTX50_30660 [Candidatus Sumerlaeota bacterium]|nr:hypothetical protein [Candidatus Sumerlaeota bacterium]